MKSKLLSAGVILPILSVLVIEAKLPEPIGLTTVSVSSNGDETSIFDIYESKGSLETDDEDNAEIPVPLSDTVDKEQFNSAMKEIIRLEDKLKKAKEKIAELENSLSLARTSNNSAIGVMNTNNSEKEELRNQLEQANAEKKEISNELHAMKEKYDDLVAKWHEGVYSYNNLQQNYYNLLEKADSNSRIAQREKELKTRLESELKKAKTDLEEVKKERDKALSELTSVNINSEAQNIVDRLRNIKTLEELLQNNKLGLNEKIRREIAYYRKVKPFLDVDAIPDDLFADIPALHIKGNEFGKHLKKLLKAEKVSGAGIKDLCSDLYSVDLKRTIVAKNIDSLVNYIGKILYSNPKERSLDDYLQLLKMTISAINSGNHNDMLPIAQTLAKEMLLSDKIL